MATHTYTYQDCPRCEMEMHRKTQMHNKTEEQIWWECPNCGIVSPTYSKNDSIQEAVSWSKADRKRRQLYND